jgi:hypothetical protein
MFHFFSTTDAGHFSSQHALYLASYARLHVRLILSDFNLNVNGPTHFSETSFFFFCNFMAIHLVVLEFLHVGG